MRHQRSGRDSSDDEQSCREARVGSIFVPSIRFTSDDSRSLSIVFGCSVLTLLRYSIQVAVVGYLGVFGQ